MKGTLDWRCDKFLKLEHRSKEITQENMRNRLGSISLVAWAEKK